MAKIRDMYYTIYTIEEDEQYSLCTTPKDYFEKHHCVYDQHMPKLDDALADLGIYNEEESEFTIEDFEDFDEAKMILALRKAGFNMIRNDTINNPVKEAYDWLKVVPIQKNAQKLMDELERDEPER